MRLFLIQAIIITFVGLGVAAFVFRSQRARRSLEFVRDAVMLYVIAILVLGLFIFIRDRW
ncbi:MAG: hypothetical protein R3B97_09175 [Dehalococcoidia bacterium]|nr:hypothetical protein [Dehalococcoidia bacterium]MCB9486579.1 hypothetical protein [Thermoflexaceae bacterium]